MMVMIMMLTVKYLLHFLERAVADELRSAEAVSAIKQQVTKLGRDRVQHILQNLAVSIVLVTLRPLLRPVTQKDDDDEGEEIK